MQKSVKRLQERLRTTPLDHGCRDGPLFEHRDEDLGRGGPLCATHKQGNDERRSNRSNYFPSNSATGENPRFRSGLILD
jgi:hypothetical protein